jgi:hypothetical protein
MLALHGYHDVRFTLDFGFHGPEADRFLVNIPTMRAALTVQPDDRPRREPGAEAASVDGIRMDASKATTCWECEVATRQPVTVAIVLSDGGRRHLSLCPACHQTYYLPLVAEASGDGVHHDPPAPDAPSTRHTRRSRRSRR